MMSSDKIIEYEDNFDEKKPLYKSENEKQLKADIEGTLIKTGLSFEMPTLNFNENYNVSDYENVKKIHSALKHLSLVQASDERLWIGLVHTDFLPFIRYRIGAEKINSGDFSRNAVLFTGSNNDKNRAKIINYLSRLWWAGYYTYDEASGEYPLLDVIAESDLSGIMTSVFSSTFTSNLAVTHGMLSAVKKYHFAHEGRIRKPLNAATQYINALSSTTMIDVFDETEIESLVTKYLKDKVF